MGKVKIHVANFIKRNSEGKYLRKNKLESGINISKFNSDWELSDKKIVVYMMPGCGPCINLYKYLKPIIKSLKDNLVKDDEDVIISALYHDPINSNNNDVEGITSDANIDNIISHYPTIFFYDNHGADYEYDGDRSKEVLKQWIIKSLGIITNKNVGKINEGSKRKRKPVKKRKSRNRKRKLSKRWKKLKKYTRKMSIMRKLKRMKKKRGKKKSKKKRSSKIKNKAKKIMKAFTRKLMNL